MEYSKLVSVVMPVHNGEQFLREAIESILNQSYTNFEFLIIENCSSDSSIEIIKSYNDPRIHLVVENDCGQVQAYNRGFKEAKGEYVFIHDQDDISHHERFEKQLKCIINEDVEICGSFMKLIDEKNCDIGLATFPRRNIQIVERLIYDCSAIHNSSVCLLKNVFKQIGFWNAEYFPVADVEFYLRVKNKFKFANIPEALYSWRKHSDQLSLKQAQKSREILKKVELEYLSYKKVELETKDYFYYKSLIFYYTDYLIYSLFYNVYSMVKGRFDKNVLRYFIILTIFGIPLKIFRKFNLVYSPLFCIIKNKFNKLF